jgi:hypothetical protein
MWGIFMLQFSRRLIFKKLGTLFVTSTAVSAILAACAEADTLATKDSVQYQTTPNDGDQCSKCRNFIPGSTAAADGTCKVVAGSISPTGYCLAFSPA